MPPAVCLATLDVAQKRVAFVHVVHVEHDLT